jgi:hypothetical protein
MQISESLRHEAGAMRVRYLRGLLIGGWNAVLAFFRSASRFLTRENIEHTRDSSA